jgi:NADPH:quinone reductase-like Zn-dependent oxidoreductase
VDVGDGVTGIATGSRVAVWQFGGGPAEYAVAKADDVIAPPDGVDDSMAACALVDYLTAHYALFVRGCLRGPAKRCWCLGPGRSRAGCGSSCILNSGRLNAGRVGFSAAVALINRRKKPRHNHR